MMSAYLINHLRIPGGMPNQEGWSYLEQVEAIVKAYGRRRFPPFTGSSREDLA
jgi:hypothetical protein